MSQKLPRKLTLITALHSQCSAGVWNIRSKRLVFQVLREDKMLGYEPKIGARLDS